MLYHFGRVFVYVINNEYNIEILGKERSITQLNVSNGWYVLDQHSNYMFQPLEAIFRLHKTELEERDILHIVCATTFQW